MLGNLLGDAADNTHDVDAALSLVKVKDMSCLFWWVLDTLVLVKSSCGAICTGAQSGIPI